MDLAALIVPLIFMKAIFLIAVLCALIAIYAVASWAVLHPHVSAAYRAYYIDHTTLYWNPVHYPGTPAEGMDFSREGLPDWVAYTRGFSIREPWGQWTDSTIAPAATVALTQSYDGIVCVDFSASAVSWLVGKQMAITMGSQTRTVKIESGAYDYKVQFDHLQNARQLDFVPANRPPRVKDVDKHSLDDRRLGLDLSMLRLLPGECASPAN